MLIRFFSITIVAVLLSTTLLASGSSAQWRGVGQIGQRGLRVAGHGYSAGYHWKNPGHDSSYYTPYSAHNSHLISQPWGSDGYRDGGFDSFYNVPDSNQSINGPEEIYRAPPTNHDLRSAPGKLDSDKSEPEPEEQASPSDSNEFVGNRAASFSTDRTNSPSNHFIPVGLKKVPSTDGDELQLNNPFADLLDL